MEDVGGEWAGGGESEGQVYNGPLSQTLRSGFIEFYH